MARIRTVKPEFWTSEQVVTCSMSARLLFIGLLNFSDDAGRHPASPKRLKMEVFPADDCTAEAVAGWIAELVAVGLVREYQAEGSDYWQVTGWRHQKIDKPTVKFPAPPDSPEVDEPSSNGRRALDEPSLTAQRTLGEASPPECKGMEGSGEESKGLERKGRSLNASAPTSAPRARTAATASSLPPTTAALKDLEDKAIDWHSVIDTSRATYDKLRLTTSRPLDVKDRELLLKVNALLQLGALSEHEHWDSCESVARKFASDDPPKIARCGYWHGVLTSKLGERGVNFNALLKHLRVPDDVLKPRSRQDGERPHANGFNRVAGVETASRGAPAARRVGE